MSDKTSQVEKKLLDIKLVKIFPSSLLSTRKNQLIDGEAKNHHYITTTLVLIAAATISTFSYRLTVITIRWRNVLSQDIQVCRKCGVVFDLNIRKKRTAHYVVLENILNLE